MKRVVSFAFVLALVCVAAPSLKSQDCPFETVETALYEDGDSCTLCWGVYCWRGALGTGSYVLEDAWWEPCPSEPLDE